MNILQVHNEYRQRGGEWTVLEQEYELLRKSFRVDRHLVSSADELNGMLSRLALVWRTGYNRHARNEMSDLLARGQVDVMHVHNFFPLLSPSIFDAAAERGVPSVMTLHNYRLIHPNGLLYSGGEIDESTLNGSLLPSVLRRVYRNSILQTAVVASMIRRHRKEGTWNRVPDRFIALTRFSKQKFVEGGLPEERISVKPNFVHDPLNNPEIRQQKPDSPSFLFAGRMEKEKGADLIIDAWLKHNIPYPLHMAGSGGLKAKLKAKSAGSDQIQWHGMMSREELIGLMRRSTALLFPSRWYEGMPMTILEAKALGCPVISSDIGNQAELVRDGIDGLHFRSGDETALAEAVEKLAESSGLRSSLSDQARSDYEVKYTPEINLGLLTGIYREAAEARREADG